MVNIANGLSQRGVDVDLVLARAQGSYLPEVSESVRVVDLDSRGVAAAIPGLVRYLRSSRPQAALSTLAYANVALIAAGRLALTASKLYLREASTPSQVRVKPLDFRGQATELLRRAAYRSADGVVAVSEAAARDIQTFVGVKPSRIHTIYNPIVDHRIAELAKQALDDHWFGPGQPPVVLGVGRLGPEKDFETLIHSFAQIRSHREVRLMILGEGSSRPKLEQQIADLGLADSVRLPGFIANPFAYMARAGLFVLSSVREGLPGVLIQAMACGCGVVSTDCPSGPYEVLDGGKYGELVPMRDESAMAAAIARGLDRRPDRQSLIARAAEFSIEKSIRAYEVMLLGGNGR